MIAGKNPDTHANPPVTTVDESVSRTQASVNERAAPMPVGRSGSRDHTHGEEARLAVAANEIDALTAQQALPPEARKAAGLPNDLGDAQGDDSERPTQPATKA